VLLANPLQIEHYLQNWNMSGAAVGAFDIVVLKSDEAFGRFARSSLSGSIGALIASIFAVDGYLLAGDGLRLPRLRGSGVQAPRPDHGMKCSAGIPPGTARRIRPC
jgi:hypothetical protein